MNERDFVFWLQGFLEISQAKQLDEKQTQIVRDHLALVLDKRTPNYEQWWTPQTPSSPFVVTCGTQSFITDKAINFPSSSISWSPSPGYQHTDGNTYCCVDRHYLVNLPTNVSC